ncbi:MAG: queuine tRNA-ribosyltransferase [Thaumarchaeota archaeon]|nr:queuine tRNA-ribosyltransferase [Nitrososphaerota archaeon]
MDTPGENRRLSIMVDYIFGKGVSRALPKDGMRLVYSRRSGRVKLVFHGHKLVATVKPSGAMALTVYGATLLARSSRFKENFVEVAPETEGFVRGGKSVFCKFVRSAGKNVYPKGEVAVVDGKGKVLGVGMAVINGRHMKLFKSGVAVKVRDGLER